MGDASIRSIRISAGDEPYISRLGSHQELDARAADSLAITDRASEGPGAELDRQTDEPAIANSLLTIVVTNVKIADIQNSASNPGFMVLLPQNVAFNEAEFIVQRYRRFRQPKHDGNSEPSGYMSRAVCAQASSEAVHEQFHLNNSR